MDKEKDILLGALIGTLFTLSTQLFTQWLRRLRVKRTITSFLNDAVDPTIEILISEIEKTNKAISKHSHETVSLGMHPTFNSTLITSFDMSDLQAIYKGKFKTIIDIIGILKNLEDRLPYHHFKNYVFDATKHVDLHFEQQKDLYPTRDHHFTDCPGVEAIRKRYISNLNSVLEILNTLKENILRLKNA